MIYVIDHNDSFTHNVIHQFSLFDKVECDNFNKIDENKIKSASTIVFSPGPGNPKNYPTTSKIYRKFKGKKKMIGICLGFQHILYCEGAKIIEQKKIYHGYQSNIKVINNKSLFQKGKIFKVGRYHSLKLREPFNSESIRITMRCSLTNIPMGLEDDTNKIYGFQFHPESFLTENGNTLIKKILSA